MDSLQSEATDTAETRPDVAPKLSDDSEAALFSAGIGALGCLLFLMLSIAMLSDSFYVTPPLWWLGFVFVGLVWIETGMTVFLIQSASFLRGPTLHRVFTGAFAAFFVVFQIAFYTRGQGIALIVPSVCGLAITSWFTQRITGASISRSGTEVFQRPISIRDILAIAPLMLLMGLIPTLMTLFMNWSTSRNFAQMVIYYSLGTALACLFPIACCYGLLLFVGSKSSARIRTVSIVTLGLIGAAVFESAFSDGKLPYVTMLIASQSACFVVGIIAGYLPFFLCKFRPAWAKRTPAAANVQDVSFDEIDA